ncbi:MAG: integral rane protein [Pseudonocardiales bacterium]|nr:integral rane protein [Pseudonocardiales bacterium]
MPDITPPTKAAAPAGLRPPPDPVPVDAARIVAAGTALWAVAFVVLLPFWSRLSDAGNLFWLWTCLCGTALGLLGIIVIRRHRGEGRVQ